MGQMDVGVFSLNAGNFRINIQFIIKIRVDTYDGLIDGFILAARPSKKEKGALGIIPICS